MRFLPYALTCLALLGPSSLMAADEVTVTFGMYTSTKPSELVKKFRPVTKAIEDSMSATLKRPVTVKVSIAAKYQDGVKDLAEGKVDFSRFGPASYIEATKLNPKVELLAMESEGGGTTDRGIICVKEDSPVAKVSDLKGKSFAFGDETSTIGRYLSQLYLLEQGVKAADLSSYEYLGRHDAVGAAVGSGRFDAGALKEETFKKLKASGTPLRELASFPNQSQAWVARAGLPADVHDALKKSLISLSDEAALDQLKADKLVDGKPSDYDVIRAAMERNDEFFQKN